MGEPKLDLRPRWAGLGLRILTAFAIVLVCILPFYVGGWIWAALVALFSGRMIFEWVRMSDPDGGYIPIGIGIIGLLVALIYAVQAQLVSVLIATGVFTLLAVAERFRRKADPVENGPVWSAIGIPYVLLPSAVIVLLRGSDVGFATEGFTQLIFIILVVIGADAGAYFGGSQFGGPKLAPRLSPKKTWSGAISGLVIALIVATIVGLFIGLSILWAVLLAIPLVLLAVFGDLLESLFKRRLGVKDTGMLLPGHGGLLDRVDSLMAAVVGGAMLFWLFGSNWPVS